MDWQDTAFLTAGCDMGKIFQTQNHPKVVQKEKCECPGCAQEGLNEEQLRGEGSRLNELEKSCQERSLWTMGEVLHADRGNEMFEFFSLVTPDVQTRQILNFSP